MWGDVRMRAQRVKLTVFGAREISPQIHMVPLFWGTGCFYVFFLSIRVIELKKK
jgi:hypothetical protein